MAFRDSMQRQHWHALLKLRSRSERRDRDIPLNLLRAGSDSIRIVMTGDTAMDRPQLEVKHAN